VVGVGGGNEEVSEEAEVLLDFLTNVGMIP